LDGKTILVIGASSGIGREIAVVLAELGARVIASGRDAGRLEATLGRLKGEGHQAEVFDLKDAGRIPEWIRGITARTGPLDGLVYSAGIYKILPVTMATVARVEETMQLNLTAAIMSVKAIRQKGCAASGASIVLISSAAGVAGQPGISIYSTSKAALNGFVRCAAMEMAPAGLRINAVAPGAVESESAERTRELLTPEQAAGFERQHPLGRGLPRDVAWAAAFLLAETGRWITGSTLIIDGGYMALRDQQV
jgi:NAD(P)-dependent dehydrogenase (short-subunit alcohol dehydrogenase family)